MKKNMPHFISIWQTWVSSSLIIGVLKMWFCAFCYHYFFSSVFLSFSLNECQQLGNCDIQAERKILVMNEMKWFAAFYFNLADLVSSSLIIGVLKMCFFLFFSTIISSLQSFCHFLSTSASSQVTAIFMQSKRFRVSVTFMK